MCQWEALLLNYFYQRNSGLFRSQVSSGRQTLENIASFTASLHRATGLLTVRRLGPFYDTSTWTEDDWSVPMLIHQDGQLVSTGQAWQVKEQRADVKWFPENSCCTVCLDCLKSRRKTFLAENMKKKKKSSSIQRRRTGGDKSLLKMRYSSKKVLKRCHSLSAPSSSGWILLHAWLNMSSVYLSVHTPPASCEKD